MKLSLSSKAKNTVGEVSSFLLIVLFVYTAVSKIITYESFRSTIAASPLIRGYSSFLSVAIPAGELFISLLLVVPRLRPGGFWLSFALLLLFTVYLIVVLSQSGKLPCSCGGVIKLLSWKGHVVFNCFFIAVALCGISLTRDGGGKFSRITE